MAKRKQQNMELERQLKQRRLIFRLVSLLVTAVIVFAIGFGIYSTQDARWVLRYDGGRVATMDFRTVNSVMWGNRDMAIDHLEHVIAIRDRAILHGVDFTDEERIILADNVNWELRTSSQMNFGFDPIPPGVSDDRLVELFAVGPLETRLTDIYLPADTITLDEDEFAELLEEYLENELFRHMDLQVHMVILTDLEEIEEAYALVGTVPFEDIIRQFNPQEDPNADPDADEDAEEVELQTASLVGIIDFFTEEDQEYLLALQPGDYSRIIEINDEGMMTYVLFHAVSREEADPDTATELFREQQIELRRSELFQELVLGWIEEANFRINRRGYNSVT